MGAITPILAAGSVLGLNLLESANSARAAKKAAAQLNAAARANADINLASLQARQGEDTAERQTALRRARFWRRVVSVAQALRCCRVWPWNRRKTRPLPIKTSICVANRSNWGSTPATSEICWRKAMPAAALS
jgi:hypothetical protein